MQDDIYALEDLMMSPGPVWAMVYLYVQKHIEKLPQGGNWGSKWRTYLKKYFADPTWDAVSKEDLNPVLVIKKYRNKQTKLG